MLNTLYGILVMPGERQTHRHTCIYFEILHVCSSFEIICSIRVEMQLPELH